MAIYRYYSFDKVVARLAKDTDIIKGVEIFRTGTFRPSNGGKIEADKTYLDDIAKNFHALHEANILPHVPHRLNHWSGIEDVAGYVVDVRREGDRLVCDIEFTNPKAHDMFKDGTLRNRSAEIGEYTDNDGNVHDPVLYGFAWVDLPAVEGLRSVIAASKDVGDVVELNRNEFANYIAKQSQAESPQHEEEEVMPFELSQVASFRLKNGSEITDTSLLELPTPEPPKVFTREIDGVVMEFTSEATATKVAAMSKENAELIALAKSDEDKRRTEYVLSLREAGKILADEEKIAAETAFTLSLSREQFDSYKARMDTQPPLIGLGKEQGSQDGTRKDEDELLKHLIDLRATYQRTGGKSQTIANLTKKIESRVSELAAAK